MISLRSKLNNQNFIIPISAWLLDKCPCDLIIGRPTITKYKLLDTIDLSGNLFKFAINITPELMIGDGNIESQGQKFDQAANSARAVTDCEVSQSKLTPQTPSHRK